MNISNGDIVLNNGNILNDGDRLSFSRGRGRGRGRIALDVVFRRSNSDCSSNNNIFGYFMFAR